LLISVRFAWVPWRGNPASRPGTRATRCPYAACLALGVAIALLLGAVRAPAGEPYETPAALRASELLPPELREGPSHRVAESVETDGMLRIYQVETPFGAFEARGEDMLYARIREVRALDALREIGQKPEFLAAEERVGPSPFASGRSLGNGATGTLGGVAPGGGAGLPGLRGPVAPGGDFLGALAGFETTRRSLAHDLGVDPYSDNEPLQRALDRHAWAMSAGGAPAPAPLAPGDAALYGERADEMLRDYSAEDLERINRIELAVMGVPEPLREAFIANPSFSPSRETVLVDALAALEGTEDRATFIEAAAQARTGEEARDYQRMAELMRSVADQEGGLARMERMAGGVAARASDGTLLVPVRADHALWTRGMAQLAETLAHESGEAAGATKTRILFSGTVSPTTRAQIERLGLSLAEDAMDAADGGADTAPKDGAP